LTKKVQNPVSDLISLPFQNSWNYGMGPERRTQWILNIQPVVPQVPALIENGYRAILIDSRGHGPEQTRCAPLHL
jgi:hypothetical protein